MNSLWLGNLSAFLRKSFGDELLTQSGTSCVSADSVSGVISRVWRTSDRVVFLWCRHSLINTDVVKNGTRGDDFGTGRWR